MTALDVERKAGEYLKMSGLHLTPQFHAGKRGFGERYSLDVHDLVYSLS
jgi:hypothetical protein